LTRGRHHRTYELGELEHKQLDQLVAEGKVRAILRMFAERPMGQEETADRHLDVDFAPEGVAITPPS
jgi:hypothetical protein